MRTRRRPSRRRGVCDDPIESEDPTIREDAAKGPGERVPGLEIRFDLLNPLVLVNPADLLLFDDRDVLNLARDTAWPRVRLALTEHFDQCLATLVEELPCEREPVSVSLEQEVNG